MSRFQSNRLRAGQRHRSEEKRIQDHREERYKQRNMIADDIEKEISVDDTRLNEELMDQPLLFKKYTKILSELERKAKLTKYKLEQTEAQLYVKYSNDGQGRKVKEVESLVILDNAVVKLKEDLAEAESLVNEFNGIVKAFHQRYEMLKELSVNRRNEIID